MLHPSTATPAESVIPAKAPKSSQHLSAVTLGHVPLRAPRAAIESRLNKNFQLLEEDCSPNEDLRTSFPCSQMLQTYRHYASPTVPTPWVGPQVLFVNLGHSMDPWDTHGTPKTGPGAEQMPRAHSFHGVSAPTAASTPFSKTSFSTVQTKQSKMQQVGSSCWEHLRRVKQERDASLLQLRFSNGKLHKNPMYKQRDFSKL